MPDTMENVSKPKRHEPPEGDEAKVKAKDTGKESRPLPRWPFVLAGIIVLGFIAVVLWIVFAPRPDVWTDDAQISVHYATVAPRVSGQVLSVEVDDNQVVRAGQLLARLDPRDYQVSVATAEAALERDKAAVVNAAANVSRQPSLITEQEATVTSAQAKLRLSQSNQRRYGNLAATGAGTAQQRQQADTTLQQDQADAQKAGAELEAARQQLEVLKAQKASQEGTVKSDQAQLEQAKLNLSYTEVRAQIDGMVGERTVQVGNYVATGATLMTVVPLDEVYVNANYREVALRHVRSGQHVTIHVDAYDIYLDGVLESVPPATGAVFSPISPSNATGNFTKIVQRLPVKIRVTPGQPSARLLRVGFSVETTIHTELADVVGDTIRQPDRAGAR